MGFLGVVDIINAISSKEREKKQAECDKIAEKEMQDFCNKTAQKYGITRGINLLDLQHQIANPGYYDEELSMKNEEALVFLEEEKETLVRLRDAMFDRMSKLPVEGFFSEDKEELHIRPRVENCCRPSDGLRKVLFDAKDYLENKGIDCDTECYPERIFNWAKGLVDETDKEIKILSKGQHGEEFVSQQLKLYEGKYKVLENIVIESNDSQGETSEVDVYIITDKGLVVAEVKNFGNENQRLHITSDGRWVIEDVYNGRVLKRIDKSPVEQNARHCLAIERVLGKELGEDVEIPIIPVVFIANNKVAIQNESQSPVIRVSEFYTFINSFSNGVKVSKETQKKIEELLERKNIGAREFTVKSRLQKMKCLEELEREFTKYVMYNNEVAHEYPNVMKRNKAHVNTTGYWLIALIPYLFIFLLQWTTNFRILLLVAYTIGIFSLPLGVFAGLIMMIFLDNIGIVLFWAVVLGIVVWMKG